VLSYPKNEAVLLPTQKKALVDSGNQTEAYFRHAKKGNHTKFANDLTRIG